MSSSAGAPTPTTRHDHLPETETRDTNTARHAFRGRVSPSGTQYSEPRKMQTTSFIQPSLNREGTITDNGMLDYLKRYSENPFWSITKRHNMCVIVDIRGTHCRCRHPREHHNWNESLVFFLFSYLEICALCLISTIATTKIQVTAVLVPDVVV